MPNRDREKFGVVKKGEMMPDKWVTLTQEVRPEEIERRLKYKAIEEVVEIDEPKIELKSKK
jgi:hypothetical protein